MEEFAIDLYWAAWAVIKNNPKEEVALTTELQFLAVLGARNPRSSFQLISYLVRAIILVCR